MGSIYSICEYVPWPGTVDIHIHVLLICPTHVKILGCPFFLCLLSNVSREMSDTIIVHKYTMFPLGFFSAAGEEQQMTREKQNAT